MLFFQQGPKPAASQFQVVEASFDGHDRLFRGDSRIGRRDSGPTRSTKGVEE
jgi:hypothetical protein